MSHIKYLCSTCGHVSAFVSDLIDVKSGTSLFGNMPPERACPRCGAEYPHFAPLVDEADTESVAEDLEAASEQATRL